MASLYSFPIAGKRLRLLFLKHKSLKGNFEKCVIKHGRDKSGSRSGYSPLWAFNSLHSASRRVFLCYAYCKRSPRLWISQIQAVYRCKMHCTYKMNSVMKVAVVAAIQRVWLVKCPASCRRVPPYKAWGGLASTINIRFLAHGTVDEGV